MVGLLIGTAREKRRNGGGAKALARRGRRRLCSSFLFGLLLIASAAGASEPPACASILESAGLDCDANGLPLPYRQAVIGSELPGKYDLVLFLHGAGERGDDNARQLAFGYEPMLRFCSENGVKAVLLFPQCPKGSQWSAIRIPEVDPPLTPEPAAPLAAAVRLLCRKRAEFGIGHVYVVGISMGGYGVWDALARYRELFDAGVAICGGGDVNQAAALAGLPLFVAHGGGDPVIPVARSRAMVQAVWNAGGQKIVYQEFPQERHDVWKRVFDDDGVWEWLFKKHGRTPPRSGKLFPVPKVFPWQRRPF